MTGIGVLQGEVGQRLGNPRETARSGVVTLLTVWLVFLFGIPASQVVGPLGAVGTPALLVAGCAAVGWVVGQLSGWFPRPETMQPLRVALSVYLWYLLATIVVAHTRRLTPLEQTASVREAVTMACLIGLAFLVMDSVTSIEWLEVLLRRLVWACTGFAIIGIIQFLFGLELVPTIPGLATNGSAEVISSRSIFNRPYSTALHPIEFGVVTAALLGLALALLSIARPGRPRQMALAAVLVIGFAVPLAVSRSGIVTLVGALAVLALGWSWRERLQAVVTGLVVIPAFWLTIPGLVGTFRGMFTQMETDTSIQARIDRVPRIMGMIRENPVFGIGAGTFSVDDYLLVDNEFFVSIIETGIVGITLTYSVLLLAVVMAITARHHKYATDATRRLGYAIAAALVGLAMGTFTFDAFFFYIYRGVLFVLLGAAGSLWMLTRVGTLSAGGRP